VNIFVTDPSPYLSAQCLPDKHVVKMPLETCQMLSIVCSDKWGHGYGQLHRINGEPNWKDGDEIDVCLGGTFAGDKFISIINRTRSNTTKH